MIEEFKNWLERNKNKFQTFGLILVDKYENKSNENNSSIVVQYENSLYISEITVRSNNFIDIEIFSKKTEELEFYIYCMATKKIQLEFLLDTYLDYMIY